MSSVTYLCILHRWMGRCSLDKSLEMATPWAVLVLIVLGAGANVGLANWLRRDYGWRAVSYFVAMLITSTIVLGFITDRSIVRGKATIDDHTHAFDGLTRLDGVNAEEAGFIWVLGKVNSSINKHADSAAAEILVLFY